MELEDAVKRVIDGDGVIITGAGASYGAQNAFGAFPSGPSLAKSLYDKCGVIPDDETDLQDASECFEQHFSSAQLIYEIKSMLYCTRVTEAQEEIFSLPWERCYTTNYDVVPIMASRKRNKNLFPVTINASVNKYSHRHDIVVYINGYIELLNEATLHNTFKLTARSYYSSENILTSRWGDLLYNDLETAKCIVLLGVSLRYDLDLSKILFSDSFKKKTIIIDKPDLTQNSENRLSRFGTVYKIGIDKFANEISRIKKVYSPRCTSLTDRLYTAFEYRLLDRSAMERPSEDSIFRLVLNGNCDDTLFCKEKGSYLGVVKRTAVDRIKKDIADKKRFIFIHSDMGNGKTICIKMLHIELLLDKIKVFLLNNPDSTKLNDDIRPCLKNSQELYHFNKMAIAPM